LGGAHEGLAVGRATSCAIKRYFATRSDNLPWLFVSEHGQPVTRQAINGIVRL
jgi:site-specific recombinase XerD